MLHRKTVLPFLLSLSQLYSIAFAESTTESDNNYIPVISEKSAKTISAIKMIEGTNAYGRVEKICSIDGGSDCNQARNRILQYCMSVQNKHAICEHHDGDFIEVLTSAHAGGTELMPDTPYGLFLNPHMFVPKAVSITVGDMVKYRFSATHLGLQQFSPEVDGIFEKRIKHASQEDSSCITDGTHPMLASATLILTYTSEISTQCEGWDSREIDSLQGWHNGYIHNSFFSSKPKQE